MSASCGSVVVVVDDGGGGGGGGFTPSDVSATGCSLSRTEITPGESVIYDVTITNDNLSPAEADIELRFDGAVQYSNTFGTIPASDDTTFSFQINDMPEGEFTPQAEVVDARED